MNIHTQYCAVDGEEIIQANVKAVREFLPIGWTDLIRKAKQIPRVITNPTTHNCLDRGVLAEIREGLCHAD